jgi:ABC-2 type transport system permease protein
VGVVSGVIIPVSLGASVFTFIEFFFISVLISVLAVCLGLLVNILFPMMNWDNESKPIKQGASILVTMALGILLAGLFGVGAYFIKVKPEILFGIILLITMALTLSVYLLIIKKGSSILDKKIG